MDLIAWVAILVVVVVGLLVILAAVWVRSAQRIVEAQEDAHAAQEQADARAEQLLLAQDALDASDLRCDVLNTALDRAVREVLSQGALHNAAAVARDEARVAARLALAAYGRERDVAEQCGQAFANQVAVVEEQRDRIGALQDEVDELRAEVDVAVDERASLREQVRAAQAATS